ncbi:MAG: hypothetical protein AAGI28_00965 [Pseudomonadota bacterium]
MDLLFKREQVRSLSGRVRFRMWAKVEFAEDEKALIDRYHFYEALVLIGADWTLFASTWWIWILSSAATGYLAKVMMGLWDYAIIGPFVGAVLAFMWFNERRQTIFMRDLIHGRRFKCRSVVDLAKKEARLEDACLVLRQVLETAKHWDGVQTNPIPALAKDEAKEVVVRSA